MRWVLLGALAWMGVLGLFFASVRWPPRPEPWVITHTTAAHETMVVTLQARAPDQALRIAHEIVEPVRTRYKEILIYIWPPGDSRGMPARRVQWTVTGGYTETVF